MSDEYDYSIKFGETPKDRRVVDKLIADSFRVLTKSLEIKREAELYTMAMFAFCERYKNVNPDELGWEEKEKIYAEAERLMNMWRAAYKKLKALDAEYEEVRQRVNTHYGSEVMPEYKLPPHVEKMYEEMMDEDNADWWKNEDE